MRRGAPNMARAFTWMLALLGLTACADSRPPAGAGLDAGAPPSIQTSADRQDAHILTYLDVANKSDIEEGRLAQERAGSMRVKDYARRMVEDHQSMLRRGRSAATQLRLAPALDSESRMVFADHTKAMEKLRNVSGRSFDRAYIRHEIETHQEVLQKIDQAGDEATHAELKQLLAESRPVIQSHLDQAMLINEALSGQGSG